MNTERCYTVLKIIEYNEDVEEEQNDAMLKARDRKEKDLRKRQILNSAEHVLETKGLNGLSISAVAREAKLAQGTLYLYFANKEELIAQLTLRSREKLLQMFHEAIERTTHPLEQLKGILIANFEYARDYKLYHELVSFYELNTHLEEPAELQQASNNISALVVAIIDRARNQDLIKPSIKGTEIAYIMWGSANGMVQFVDVKRQLIERDLAYPAAQLYERYIDFLIDAIRA